MPFNPLDYPICMTYPSRIAPSTWLSHVPFAMFLVDALRPRTIVELGTYYGVSYCAFCQAVRELGIDTQCYAIDTWLGDPQSPYFEVDVFDDLKAYHDPLYANFSRLIRSTFLEASKSFADKDIDLLHIDGYHSYDMVKLDYQTWLPKMSPRGIMLFHDIRVLEPGFGVWRLWDELKSQHPSFEFLHGCGLGLLAVGSAQAPSIEQLTNARDEEAARIRGYFERLGAWPERDAQKQTVIAGQQRRIGELESFVEQVRRNPFFKLYHRLKYFGKR